jgi:hypothetical protein
MGGPISFVCLSREFLTFATELETADWRRFGHKPEVWHKNGLVPDTHCWIAYTVERVAPRLRIVAFGSAAVLVVAGGACAALVEGVTGEVLTIVLMSAGLAGGLLLVFLEIGLSEERDLAHDEERRRKLEKRALDARRRPRLRQRPRRPG